MPASIFCRPVSNILRTLRVALIAPVVTVLMLGGCATPPPADADADEISEWKANNDPLEPMNRAMFAVNQAVDKAVIKPVAQGYQTVVPVFGRQRVHDFITNLRSPVILANDLMQGEPDLAAQTFSRFFMNTGFGIAGLFDVATEGGIPFHDQDFGLTLARWGVGEGPYLVLPLLGPSNPRDATGIVAEWVSDPFNIYMDNTGREWLVWTRAGVAGLDKRQGLLDSLDDVERNSVDYYAALRTLYRQQRAQKLNNAKAKGQARTAKL